MKWPTSGEKPIGCYDYISPRVVFRAKPHDCHVNNATQVSKSVLGNILGWTIDHFFFENISEWRQKMSRCEGSRWKMGEGGKRIRGEGNSVM